MKRLVILTLIASFAVLFFVSCTSIKSVYYVGKMQPVFKGNHSVSIWKRGSSVFYVKPIDDYTAVVSTLEWDKSLNKFKQTDSTIIISELDDQVFLNLKSEGEYTIVRMTQSLDGPIVLFAVNSSKLKADVKSGLIKVKENIDIGKTNPIFTMEMSKRKLDKYILENMNELFGMGHTMVVIPIVRDEVKENAE